MGASVFNFYDNFAGTTLNTNKWTSDNNCGTMSFVVNNGIVFSPSNSMVSTQVIYPGTVIDMFAKINTLGYKNSGCFLDGIGIVQPSYTTGWATPVGTGYGLIEYPTSPSSVNFPLQPSSSNYYVWSTIFSVNGALSSTYDYSNSNLITGTTSTTIASIWLVSQSATGATISAYWVRTRADPPNGVMPSYSFGSFS